MIKEEAEFKPVEIMNPAELSDNVDGWALHRLLYNDGHLDEPCSWAAPATATLVQSAVQTIQRRRKEILETHQDAEIRVVDYGTGTGMAACELIKILDEGGMLAGMRQQGIRFELNLLDLPSHWFDFSKELLGHLDFVKFHDSFDPVANKFVPLQKLLGVGGVDVVMASMVFHLIQPPGLMRAVRGIGAVLRQDGELFWSAPDIGPALDHSILFHDPNRMARQEALRCLDEPSYLANLLGRLSADEASRFSALPAAVAKAKQSLTAEARLAALTSAGQQVLTVSNSRETLTKVLDHAFEGEIRSRVIEMLPKDSLAALRIPSNQRILEEIADLDVRASLLNFVMEFAVLPKIVSGPAGTSSGYGITWSFGSHTKPKKGYGRS